MEMILWGAVGGIAVLALGGIGTIKSLPESAWEGGSKVLSAISYHYFETLESLKDLVAESRMEFEAESTAIEEVRMHTEKDAEGEARKPRHLKLIN